MVGLSFKSTVKNPVYIWLGDEMYYVAKPGTNVTTLDSVVVFTPVSSFKYMSEQVSLFKSVKAHWEKTSRDHSHTVAIPLHRVSCVTKT